MERSGTKLTHPEDPILEVWFKNTQRMIFQNNKVNVSLCFSSNPASNDVSEKSEEVHATSQLALKKVPEFETFRQGSGTVSERSLQKFKKECFGRKKL